MLLLRLFTHTLSDSALRHTAHTPSEHRQRLLLLRLFDSYNLIDSRLRRTATPSDSTVKRYAGTAAAQHAHMSDSKQVAHVDTAQPAHHDESTRNITTQHNVLAQTIRAENR